MYNTEYRQKACELVAQMTVEEKAERLRYDSPALKRLGIPAYNWWNESLHGVARAGTSTMFPQAIAMAAMFDEQTVNKIAGVIADEGRAKYAEFSNHCDRGIYKGLTFWAPNINIFRDPRWGRGHETYGEDPYLTARLGVAYIKGLQVAGKHLKAAACAKHFAVHSGPENDRHHFDAVCSEKDLWETYLPAFEAAVTEANVEAVMGAYNKTNGEPCCASPTLLTKILREKWGFEGHVVSDCWAIRDFHTTHMITATAPESAALALQNGCDLNCGNTYLHVLQAYQDGLVTEQDITRAAERVVETMFKLGILGEKSEYQSIPFEVVDCKAHNDLSLEAAVKSIVLLKNDGILPLDQKVYKNIAVIGPNANSREALTGNYTGTASHYTTILEGIQNAAGPDCVVRYAEGSHLYKQPIEVWGGADNRISEAIITVEHSDVVVLCLGLDSTIEGEQSDDGNLNPAGDKTSLELPLCQQKLLNAVLAVGKKTILLLSSGSAIDLRVADEKCNAVLQTWYGGAHGGTAAANILFGKASPSGRLPVTFYKSTDDLPDFKDYSMENRTYRYMKTDALYSFGYGLSYARFVYSNLSAQKRGQDMVIQFELQNMSDIISDEVAQVYLKINGSINAVPNYSLCGFKRITLCPGEHKSVEITVAQRELMVVDESGNRVLQGDRHTFYVGGSAPDKVSCDRLGTRPLSVAVSIN